MKYSELNYHYLVHCHLELLYLLMQHNSLEDLLSRNLLNYLLYYQNLKDFFKYTWCFTNMTYEQQSF